MTFQKDIARSTDIYVQNEQQDSNSKLKTTNYELRTKNSKLHFFKVSQQIRHLLLTDLLFQSCWHGRHVDHF